MSAKSEIFFSDLYYSSIVNVVWSLNLVLVNWNNVVIAVLDLIFRWCMLKLHSNCILSQFISSTQKQRSDSIVLLHVVFYQVKRNLWSRRSVIFQFKKCCGIKFHWQFWTTNSCFWLVFVFCCRNFILHQRNKKNEMKILKTKFLMIKNNKIIPNK